MVLLAADFSLVRSVILEMLLSHGYQVLSGGNRDASLSIGRTYPGQIHLLVADVDQGSEGGGHGLAEILSYVRPHMQALFLKKEKDSLWLVRDPDQLEANRIPFTPGHFLEWTANILSEAFSE